MKNQPTGLEQPKIFPELPESFTVEFLNSKRQEALDAMREIGNFSFRRSGSEEEIAAEKNKN